MVVRRTGSAVATTAAAGSPAAISPAKLGPVRTAAGVPGWSASNSSSGRWPVPVSMPLAHMTTGAAGRKRASTWRRCCIGMASRIASWPGPGRVVVVGRRARAGSRAQRVTVAPARVAWSARAQPQAPAPTMAMLLMGDPSHGGAGVGGAEAVG